MNIFEDIARASIHLLLTQPFYAHYLTALNKVIDSEQAQSLLIKSEPSGFTLYIHPAFWQSLKEEDIKAGALLHELLHWLLRHPFQATQYKNRQLFNLAADLVVNQYLRKERRQPNIPIIDTNFPLDVKTPLSLSNCYNLLSHIWQQPQSPAYPLLWRWLEDADFSSHQHWWNTSSPLIRTAWENNWQQQNKTVKLRITKEGITRLPEAIQRNIGVNIAQTDYLNWRKQLRMFTASSRQTRLVPTVRRPSRRYGTTPGLSVRRKQSLLVAVDSSGSIQQEDLALFFREVYQIWRAGAEITVIECDDTIRHIWPYRGQNVQKAQGGGGTLFDPVMQYIQSHPGFDGLIYFTDGRANAPVMPCSIPLLWVISPGGITPDEDHYRRLPGQKIKLYATPK